ncbi:hypothetical protein ACQFN5_11900 [Klebsiella sp. WOUb02]|uniref:hypothetical protein n=1 Tax=Klebsiella sp. WOUb02 TaxID=3161071 RepID=UPI003CF7BA04
MSKLEGNSGERFVGQRNMPADRAGRRPFCAGNDPRFSAQIVVCNGRLSGC